MNPKIHKSSFIAKTAVIIGNVKIGRNCGVFPNAVIRGDQNSITIDNGSNIQDCCVIHTDENHRVIIGKNVSIGHSAVVHGAILEDECLIGMNVTILNGVKIGSGSIIGANTLIKTGMNIPENSMVLGIPGKIVKQDENFREIARHNAETYKKLSKNHLEGKYITYRENYL
jgi:carbonic anhydrase/acetyltransferase-like protein (isoleucine patch superfamily)